MRVISGVIGGLMANGAIANQFGKLEKTKLVKIWTSKNQISEFPKFTAQIIGRNKISSQFRWCSATDEKNWLLEVFLTFGELKVVQNLFYAPWLGKLGQPRLSLNPRAPP